MRKNIFIVSQKGLNPSYNQWAKEAVEEFMDMFPDYKNDYPISNLGNWKSNKATINKFDYLRLPAEERKLAIPMTDGNYLAPYESMDWTIAIAKTSAFLKDRPNQMNASLILDLMDKDPTVQKFPQIAINLVKDDIFATTNGEPNNFVYGLGRFDGGMVLSTHRYEQQYGNTPLAMKEVIKTIVMHELGHIFGATVEGRNNVSNRDGYGQHCNCPDCIMRSDSVAKSDRLTNDRLKNKRNNKPPLCKECQAMAEAQMAQLSGNSQKIYKATNNFNRITNEVQRRR
ncbi:MAG: hypothetical protein PHE89_04910 [Alphaproteobacteria bacterium]|nr:hypothetical protein [Alphaproteobacteria bacterium]